MPHNPCLQGSIADASYCSVNCISHRVIAVEHAQCTVRDALDRCVVVGRCMQLGAIVSTSERESTYYVRVSHHVDLDEPCRRQDSMFIGDGEGDKIRPDVVDEPFWWVEWHHRLRCCCMCVSRGGRWPYQLGLCNSSCLPSSSSSLYSHPLGRPFICWDERGCWYFDSIFVVFINELGNLSCQCCNVRMHEANSGHFSMWCVWGSDKYGCEWCRYREWIGGVVSVTVLHGSVASVAVSIIQLVVWVTGIIPAACLTWFLSSMCCQVVRSCSLCHAMAICIPSEGSEGSRMSKDTHSFGKFN